MRSFLVFLLALAGCAPSNDSASTARGEIGDQVASSQADSTTARPAPKIPADAPLVVFLGDSISAGLHLPAELAFPAVLQADLAQAGHPFRLVNAGVSGDTSAGGLARLEWILKQKPAVVVVELGGNDALRGQDLAAIEANLRAIVTQARQSGAKVLLLGMRIPPSYGKEYADGFAELYAQIAGDMSIPLVPYFMEHVGGVPELILSDGLHPNARGHEILAHNVAPSLTELLTH
jgi:acyl-CoA thioesterase-1